MQTDFVDLCKLFIINFLDEIDTVWNGASWDSAIVHKKP
jgi:hypothetical protein